jgi:arylsulfatase A-like enzyme
VLVVALLAPIAGTRPRGQDQGAPARPNVVLVLADDVDCDMMAEFPSLTAAIGHQGAVFDAAFVNVALCCPSRATLLTGRYAHNTGVYDNSSTLGGWAAFQSNEGSTIATWLQAAGYRTALMGKYMNRYPGMEREDPPVPPGWTKWVVPIKGNRYGQYDYTLLIDGKEREKHASEPSDYLDDVISERALSFVKSSIESGDPFFLVLSTYGVHDPAPSAPRHQASFVDATAPRDPNFDEEDVGDKPNLDRRPLDEAAIEAIDEAHRRRLASMRAVEEAVVRLVDVLEEGDALDQTYIVFTSDNGYHQGEHRIPCCKGTPYEESVRVPLQIRGPGIAPGQRIASLVLNTDLAPTFAAFAGVAPGHAPDGRSLLPLIDGSAPAPWRQAILLEYKAPISNDPSEDDLEAPGNVQTTPFVGLRTARYKWIEWGNGQRELYDLQVDPWEMENIAAKAPEGLSRALSAWTAALFESAGPTSITVEDAPPVPLP